MTGEFKGRRAVVTDGASGIGLATARRLASRGARVVNNAGIGAQGTIVDNDAQWYRVFDVNVVGMARVSRAALLHLRHLRLRPKPVRPKPVNEERL